MNTIEICAKLEATTYLVNAFTGPEPLDPETTIGLGSAVAINSKGDLLTAAHVIAGDGPVKPKDINDPNLVILAFNKDTELIQYIPYLVAPSFTNEYVTKPITVDLAILRPFKPRQDVPYLRTNFASVSAGQQVLMAGYPDDMSLPFSFDRLLNYRLPEIQAMNRNVRIAQQLTMIKSGMIGHSNEATLTDGQVTLVGDIFYVDNAMHSGASGGPVVNMSAEVIGIVTQRAITSVGSAEAPNLKVPSGSTIAVSTQFLRQFLTKL
jgi:hypothetical protein